MLTRTLRDGRKAQLTFYNDVYRVYVEEYPGSHYWREDMVFCTEESAKEYFHKLD